MFGRGNRKIYYLFPGTAWRAGCQIWWDPRDCGAVGEQQSHHLISCFIHFDFTKTASKDSVPSWQCDLVPRKWGGTEKEKKHNKTFGILLSSALPIKADDEKMTQLTLGDLSERLGSKTGQVNLLLLFVSIKYKLQKKQKKNKIRVLIWPPESNCL